MRCPKLPVVRSRKSRVSGQPSQVAGALIPDNTQHPWRGYVRTTSNERGEGPCSSWIRSLNYHNHLDR